MRKIYGQTGMMNKMCACMCMLCAVNLSVRVPLRA